jgi:hypothetical protein
MSVMSVLNSRQPGAPPFVWLRPLSEASHVANTRQEPHRLGQRQCKSNKLLLDREAQSASGAL